MKYYECERCCYSWDAKTKPKFCPECKTKKYDTYPSKVYEESETEIIGRRKDGSLIFGKEKPLKEYRGKHKL